MYWLPFSSPILSISDFVLFYNYRIDPKEMDKNNIEALKMSPYERSFLRRFIVRLHIQGRKTAEIAEITGVKKRHIQSAVKKYKEGGAEAIALKKMGRPTGKNTVMTIEQEATVKETIIKNTPESMKLTGFLWSMKNIIDLMSV
jgi:transposase